MKLKSFFLKVFFLLVVLIFPISCFASTKISFNSSWKYANESKINSGSATLYEATSNSNGYTVAVNAGHGTRGGTSKANNTYSHPDHTPKIKGGTNPAGAEFSTAVSSGMTFNDGTPEATVTLQMAKIVKDKLLDKGYNVLMIRESEDVQLDNIARTVIANNNADIHVSLHWDGDGSKINYDKGAFFMSVVNDSGYRNMEPVKSMYQKHDELGRTIIKTMKNDGIKIFGNGEMENDLTQTSYSTIPSIDFEFGNEDSDHDEATLNKLATSFVKGIDAYFGIAGITPGQSQSGGGSTNTTTLNLSDYSLTSEQKTKLEEAMKSWPSEMEKGRVEIIKKALSLIGKGITYSQELRAEPDNPNPKHHDCSSYVSWVFYQGGFDIGLKCTSDFVKDTANFSKISKPDLIPGDIALNNEYSGCGVKPDNHVGIYFGNVNGQNIYLHSTIYGGVSGPQIRYGEGNFKVYYRYKNFGNEMTSVDDSSGGGSSKGSSGNVLSGLDHDKHPDNGFTEVEVQDITCKNIFMKSETELNDLGEFVQGLFNLIKIATPILVLLLTTIDYIKALTNQDDAEIKKVTQKGIKRLIFGVIIFLLPFLLDLLFHAFGLYDISTCGIGSSEIIIDPGD